MAKRREHSAGFKARVAFEATKEEKSIKEIAVQFELHPNVVRQWKAQFLENADSIFEDKRARKKETDEIEGEIYKQNGQFQSRK